MKARLLRIALLFAVLLLYSGFRAIEERKGAMLRYAVNVLLSTIDEPPPASASSDSSAATRVCVKRRNA